MPNQRSPDKERFSFWINRRTKRLAERLAEQRGQTFTEVITNLLESELKNVDIADLPNIDWSDEAWLPIARELACIEMGVSELSEIGDDDYAENIVQQCLARVRGKSHAETQKMISDALRDREIIDEMDGKKPAKKKSARKRA